MFGGCWVARQHLYNKMVGIYQVLTQVTEAVQSTVVNITIWHLLLANKLNVMYKGIMYNKLIFILHHCLCKRRDTYINILCIDPNFKSFIKFPLSFSVTHTKSSSTKLGKLIYHLKLSFPYKIKLSGLNMQWKCALRHKLKDHFM